MATHSSILAWRIPGMGACGLLSMGSHRVGHNWHDLAAAAGDPKLRLWVSTTRVMGSIPGLRTKIWHVAWCGQKEKKRRTILQNDYQCTFHPTYHRAHHAWLCAPFPPPSENLFPLLSLVFHICRRPEFDPWVRKIPWRRAWQPTPVFLPGQFPWTEEPGRLQSTGSQRVRHDWSDLARTLYGGQFCAPTNNTATDILAHIFCKHMSFSGCTPRRGIAGPQDVDIPNLMK